MTHEKRKDLFFVVAIVVVTLSGLIFNMKAHAYTPVGPLTGLRSAGILSPVDDDSVVFDVRDLYYLHNYVCK